MAIWEMKTNKDKGNKKNNSHYEFLSALNTLQTGKQMSRVIVSKTSRGAGGRHLSTYLVLHHTAWAAQKGLSTF